MKKIKLWLKPTSHKVIAGLIAFILVVGIGLGIYIFMNTNKAEEPVIVFKDNLVFEYGQKSFVMDDGNGTIIKEELPVINAEDIIDKEKSKYDEVSFNKLAVNEPITLEFRFVNTAQVGEHEGTLYALLGDKAKEFTFKYRVEDTHAPELSNIHDITITEGEIPDFGSFRAKDIIEGDLEVKIEGHYDANQPGTYELKAVAVDNNDNVTEESFRLIVKEKPQVTPPDNNNGGGNSDNGNPPDEGSSGGEEPGIPTLN